MFRPLDLQKTPWKDLGAHALALGQKTEEAIEGGGRPASGEMGRRRRRLGCGGARGARELPRGGLG